MRQPETLDPAPMLRPADELRAAGPGRAATEVAAVPAERGPFWLHFDVDVLDQDVFPATDYLMPGGLDWDELRARCSRRCSPPPPSSAPRSAATTRTRTRRACGRALVEALAAAAG